MPSPNNNLNWIGLARVLFRWKRTGLAIFYTCLALTVLAAIFRSPRYESQVVLERKPTRVTPVIAKSEDERFDVYRLTSESQWSVALLKSRFIMERWLAAVGLPAENPQQKEDALRRLAHSLTVQPISYTDLFMVKVRALTPEEANRRAGLLVDVFAKWDLEQNRTRAQELVGLLQSRIKQVNQDLSDEWAKLKALKATQTLSLSGSSAARQLELDINSKGKLYDMLTTELEEADRQLNSDQLPRSRPLSAPSFPGSPLLSRFQLFVLGLCMSLLAALAAMFLQEWQDPSIRRSQDIVREVPRGSVVTVPALPEGRFALESASYLAPVSDAVSKLVRDRGSAVVQFASPGDGDGKSTFSASLARQLAAHHKVCLVHRSRTPVADRDRIKSSGDYGVVDIDMSEPLADRLQQLKSQYDLVLIDTDSAPDMPPGSNLAPEAQMACVLVSAGRTTRQFFHAFRSQLQRRVPEQQLVFILNRYEDPLPPWFQQLDIPSIPSLWRRFF
jgi:hypothetical protein